MFVLTESGGDYLNVARVGRRFSAACANHACKWSFCTNVR